MIASCGYQRACNCQYRYATDSTGATHCERCGGALGVFSSCTAASTVIVVVCNSSDYNPKAAMAKHFGDAYYSMPDPLPGVDVYWFYRDAFWKFLERLAGAAEVPAETASTEWPVREFASPRSREIGRMPRPPPAVAPNVRRQVSPSGNRRTVFVN